MTFLGGNQKSVCEERTEVRQISQKGTEIKWGKVAGPGKRVPSRGKRVFKGPVARGNRTDLRL